MKKMIFFASLFLFASSALFAQLKAGKVDNAKHAIFYTCPHHSDVMSKVPGKCPKCGMDLNLSNKEQMKAEVTRNYTCPVHLDVASHDPGKCPKCGKRLSLSPKEQMKVEVMKIYTCPMHPEVAFTKDGVCPKCSKALVEKKKS